MRLWAAAALVLLSTPSWAGSVSQGAAINVRQPPLTFGLPELEADCAWAPGQMVAILTTKGGDGKPVTWSLTGNADFVINASTGEIDVGANGIAAVDCGTTVNLTVTATQP